MRVPGTADGLPEWTCLDFYAMAVFASIFLWPIILNAKWMYAFISALLGGTIKDFCKSNHKWDTLAKKKAK